MRFKLPSGVGGVSVGGQSFSADASGIIEAPDLSMEDQLELTNVVGAKALSSEDEDAAAVEAQERAAVISRLRDLGVPIDGRRRFQMGILRELLEDAEQDAADRAATSAVATEKAPEKPGKPAKDK